MQVISTVTHMCVQVTLGDCSKSHRADLANQQRMQLRIRQSADRNVFILHRSAVERRRQSKGGGAAGWGYPNQGPARLGLGLCRLPRFLLTFTCLLWSGVGPQRPSPGVVVPATPCMQATRSRSPTLASPPKRTSCVTPNSHLPQLQSEPPGRGLATLVLQVAPCPVPSPLLEGANGPPRVRAGPAQAAQALPLWRSSGRGRSCQYLRR